MSNTPWGGLTQTFRRQDWTFAPGVHYIGGVGPQAGPEGQFGRLLAWLTDDALRFTSCANPHDIVHLPGFEFGISYPEPAYREALLARFAQQAGAIAHWFESCEAARRSSFALFASHGMPHWMTKAIDGAIQILPLATDRDECFVRAPTASDGVLAATEHLASTGKIFSAQRCTVA